MNKQVSKRALGLLMIYMFVVIHQVFAQSHLNDITVQSKEHFHHHHGGFTDVHHEHQFHIGIFHFLGHLLEKVSHIDADVDAHQIMSFEVLSIDRGDFVISFVPSRSIFIVETNHLEAHEGIDPPDDRIRISERFFSATPLRAPPSAV